MIAKLENHYFPKGLIWTFTIGFAFLSAYLIYSSIFMFIIPVLVLFTIVAISTKSHISIDKEQKVILDYFQFLWIKTRSEKIEFQNLKQLTLDKEKHIYRANTRGADAVKDFNEYIGILEFDENKSVELMRKMDYKPFISSMQRMAAELNLPINRIF